MKVIKKQDTTNWSHKHICDKCDSELEVEATDIHYQYHNGDMRDPGYGEYWATCPVCAVRIGISKEKMPKLIRLAAEKRGSGAISIRNYGWEDH